MIATKRMKVLGFVSLIGLAVTCSAANAAVLITANEVGANVVFNVQGSLQVPELSGGFGGSSTGFLTPSSGTLYIGNAETSGDIYNIDGPALFGTGLLFTGTATGDAFYLAGSQGFVGVPDDYQSGDPISASLTITGVTFAELGMTPGSVFIWTLLNDTTFAGLFDAVPSIGDTITLNVGNVSAVPVPAALPLLASGIGALGYAGWRRSKKNKITA